MLFGLFIIVTAEQWFLLAPTARAQVNTFCASNLACTVTGAWSFAGPTALPGGILGPSPWYDVLANGLKCNNSTDDSAALQSIVNAADANVNGVGGTIFFPSSIGNFCLVSSLSLNGKSNITFLNGALVTPFSNVAVRQPLKFSNT